MPTKEERSHQTARRSILERTVDEAYLYRASMRWEGQRELMASRSAGHEQLVHHRIRVVEKLLHTRLVLEHVARICIFWEDGGQRL